MKGYRQTVFSRNRLSVVIGQILATGAAAGVAASVAMAANLTVDSSSDSGGGSACTLREAVEAINTLTPNADCEQTGTLGNNDTILFDSDLSGDTIELEQGQLWLQRDMTITGLGQDDLFIDGGNSSRVFLVGNASTVEISGVTVQNGYGAPAHFPPLGGGILVWDGSSLSLDKSTVTSNFSRGDGGISNYGNLSLHDSNVTQNTAIYSAGGIGNWRGANATLIDSTVSDNTAQYNSGGIYNGYRSELLLINSTVSDNVVTGDRSFGGGIYNSYGGRMRLLDSTVSGNSAGYAGGGIFSYAYANATLISSTVSNNTSYFGGGIENNGYYNYRNGQLYIYGVPNLLLVNSTVSGNTAERSGGGIENYFGNATLINSTVANNYAAVQGGALLNYVGNVTLFNTILADSLPNGQADCDNDVFAYGNNSPGTLTGTVLLQGENLIETDAESIHACDPDQLTLRLDPDLGPLANNGGPTETQALLLDSPAIDAGADCAGPPVNGLDQRGEPRDQACDIGAYEGQAVPIPTLSAWAMGLLGGLLVLGAAFRRRKI